MTEKKQGKKVSVEQPRDERTHSEKDATAYCNIGEVERAINNATLAQNGVQKEEHTSGEEKPKAGSPGRIIPKRHYDSTPGIVFISMAKIIDSYYKKAEETYYECEGSEQCRNHVFPHMLRVRRFLEELKHCDEPLDEQVEENEVGAESPAEK